MVSNSIIGSEIAEKTGWNEETMLILFNDFITESGLEDELYEFLEKRADEENDEEED
jgi:hypothetical protein